MITDKESLAGICGLFCGTCPAYPAQCHGCLSDYVADHCQRCANGFRACAKAQQVTWCFQCERFPCARLKAFQETHVVNGIGHHQQVIEDLTQMKIGGVTPWVEVQIATNTCPKCGQMILWYEKNQHSCGE